MRRDARENKIPEKARMNCEGGCEVDTCHGRMTCCNFSSIKIKLHAQMDNNSLKTYLHKHAEIGTVGLNKALQEPIHTMAIY